MAELWNEPRDLEARNLRWGSGRPADQPSASIEYKVLGLDQSGYSAGDDVVDADGRPWDIKIGREAQSEVVLSRILWALGYHQPPTYYLAGWRGRFITKIRAKLREGLALKLVAGASWREPR
jgi:hypothetical protein